MKKLQYPITYNKLLEGQNPPAGVTPYDLSDDTVGPLARAWLIAVTNPKFLGASSAELDAFGEAIGADRAVVDYVLKAATDITTAKSFAAVTGAWASITTGLNYGGGGGQDCPGTLSDLNAS